MSPPSRSTVVAEFNGHPLEYLWNQAYVDAIRAVRDQLEISIVDLGSVSDVEDGLAPTVLLRVIRAIEVEHEACRNAIASDCSRQANTPGLAIGIAPYGETAVLAANAISTRVGAAPPGLHRLIAGAASMPELRDLLYQWLIIFAELQTPVMRERSASERVIADELPDTPAKTQPESRRSVRRQP